MQTITLQNLLNRLHFESNYYTAELIESNKNNKITIDNIRQVSSYLRHNNMKYLDTVAGSIVDCIIDETMLNERYNEICEQYKSIDDLVESNIVKKITDKESENKAKYLAIYLSQQLITKKEIKDFVKLIRETIEAHSDNELLKRFF